MLSCVFANVISKRNLVAQPGVAVAKSSTAWFSKNYFQKYLSTSSTSGHWKTITRGNINSTIINGHHVEFKVIGHGPELILCNPGFMSKGTSQFDGFESWLKKDITLITWNPPTRKSNGELRELRSKLIEDADIASELMRTIHAEKYHIFGFSNGSVSSVFLAASKPDVVEKLVLCNATHSFHDSSTIAPIKKYLSRELKAMKTMPIPQALQVYVDNFGYEHAVNMIADYLEFIASECQDGFVSRKFALRCTQIEGPVLLLQATGDKLQLQLHIKTLMSPFSSPRLIEIPGEGHDMVQYAEKIGPLVLQFLRTSKNAST